MDVDAKGLFAVFLIVVFALFLILIGKQGGPVGWFILGNSGVLLLIAVGFGLLIVAFMMLAEE